MSTARIRTRLWRDGSLVAEGFPLEDLSTYLAEPGCLVWADLLDPGEAELAALAAELDLDAHAVEDALGRQERPKAARYATHLFLTAWSIEHAADTRLLSTARVSAFCLERALVTVRLSAADGAQNTRNSDGTAGTAFDIDAVVRRWDDNADLMVHGTRALVHGLLDVIVDGYFAAIESLDDQIEEIEDVLFDENPKGAHSAQRQTFALRKCLVQTRRAVLPMREVVNTVMRRITESDDHNGTDFAALLPYYSDLYDHTLRAAEWTDSLRDMITSIFETNMSLADTRMNLIMKKLTSWAAIIAVPTAITGYFGMNVPYPGFDKHWGFVLSVVVMVTIAIALYVTFRRKDWL